MCRNICICQKKIVSLRYKRKATHKTLTIMATYSMTINERSNAGQALLAYLSALKVDLQRMPNIRLRKSSYERSMDDIKHGRVESFASADEMCKSLGI